MKKTPAQKTQQGKSTPNVSKTDIRTLPVARLKEIRAEIDELLKDDYPSVRDDDLVLEYSVRLVSSKGVEEENIGSLRFNRILHKRLLAEAPSRFEEGVRQQVTMPISAALYDLLDAANPTDGDVNELQHTIKPTELSIPAVS